MQPAVKQVASVITELLAANAIGVDMGGRRNGGKASHIIQGKVSQPVGWNMRQCINPSRTPGFHTGSTAGTIGVILMPGMFVQ